MSAEVNWPDWLPVGSRRRLSATPGGVHPLGVAYRCATSLPTLNVNHLEGNRLPVGVNYSVTSRVYVLKCSSTHS